MRRALLLLALLVPLHAAFAADDPGALAQRPLKAHTAGQYAAVAASAKDARTLSSAGRRDAALHGDTRGDALLASTEQAQAKRDKLWNSVALATPYAPQLSEDERVAGLSRIWSEAKFDFVYFDRLPDLDWDALYLSYLPRVRAAASTTEYYQLLMRFIAQLKDGHTTVTPPAEVQLQLFGEPALRVADVEGHVVVTEVFDASLGVGRGDELVAVDGVPVRQYAAERVTPLVAASTPQDLAARTWRRLLMGPEASNVELTLLDANGGNVKRSVRRLTAEEEAKVTPVVPPFELRMLPGDVAYVALNEFADSRAADEFDAHFGEIAKASALVIDVRRNGGGSGAYGFHVLSTLTSQPFLTARWSTRDYKPTLRAWGQPEETFVHPAEEVQPDGKRLYARPVVVLTGPRTFSAAEDFTMAFDEMRRGWIIGEPTGGSTGQPLPFKLPGGGSARICTKHDTYPDGREFVGAGVQPQLVVHPTLVDVRAGRDAVLDAALEQLTVLLLPVQRTAIRQRLQTARSDGK